MTKYKCPMCESSGSFWATANIIVRVVGVSGEIKDRLEPLGAVISNAGDMKCFNCGYNADVAEFNVLHKAAHALLKENLQKEKAGEE